MDIQITRACRFAGVDYSTGLYTAALGNAFVDAIATLLVANGAAIRLSGESRTIPANFNIDAFNNVTMSGPGGALSSFGNTHVQAALVGDSISQRVLFAAGMPALSASAIAPWNWANWLLGAPFVFTHNFGVSGDTSLGAFSRISSIPANIQVVFVMAGINDVVASTSSATIIANFTSGIANIIAAGKTIVVSTILPNNNATAPQGIVLLAVNTFIRTLPVTYPGKVFLVDGFAAMWNGVTTGSGVAATTGYLASDGVHPSASGAQAFGLGTTTSPALIAAFKNCFPDINVYDDFQLNQGLYTEFRSSTGGNGFSGGVGTTGIGGDGWQSVRPGTTGTFVSSNATPYAPPTTFIGSASRLVQSIASYFNTLSSFVTSAADKGGLQNNSNIYNTNSSAQDGLFAGAQYFFEAEVTIASPVNLGEVSIEARAYFSVGVSPADQAAYGTSTVSTLAGSTNEGSSANAISLQACRYLMRTPVMRVPENISTAAVSMALYMSTIAVGGSMAGTSISWAKPRLWVKNTGRMG